MKIIKGCKFLICFSLFGFSAIALNANQKTNSVVHAEEPEVRDMSKAAMEEAGKTYDRWEAKYGDFVKVEDWLYSNKGFSFEFQFQNPLSKKEAVVALRSGGTNVACGTSNDYLIWINKTTGALSSDFGSLVLIDETEGWYKFDVMFAEIGDRLFASTSATGHETVDELYFSWAGSGYINDVFVRNMKVIDFEEQSIPSGQKQIWSNNATSNANQNRKFLAYKDWYNCGKGFFLEFKFWDASCHLHGQLMGTSANKTYNKAAISKVRYLVNSSDNVPYAVDGRLHEIGNGWFRYEAMFSTFAPTTNDDECKQATLQGFNFQWGNGYQPSVLKSFGIIDGLCNKITFVAGETSSIDFRYGKAVKPANPTVEGKHFVSWYTEPEFTNEYKFDTDLTSDITLYAKFDDHSYINPSYDWAEDFSTVKGTATCSCGDVLEETANGNYVKDADATCLSNELGHFEATFTKSPFENQATEEKSYEKTGTKLNHTLSHHDRNEASCVEDGNIEYWECESCHHYFSDSAGQTEVSASEIVIGAKGHSVELVEGKSETCLEDGWKDYYECSKDHVLFEDEQMIIEISDLEAWKVGDGKISKHPHTLSLVNGKKETCSEDGWKNYYECSECHGLFEDSEGNKPITDLEAWKVGTGRIAAHGHDDNNVTIINGKQPGCDEPGYKDAYFCMECGKYFEDVNATKLIGDKESDLDAWRLGAGKLNPKGHTYKYVEEVAATKDKDGVKAHYVCEYCGKLFVKEGETYKEVTLNDLTIKYQAKGCGGSIVAASALGLIISSIGFALISLKKKKD